MNLPSWEDINVHTLKNNNVSKHQTVARLLGKLTDDRNDGANKSNLRLSPQEIDSNKKLGDICPDFMDLL